ncbi:unnamed protein product [Caenorhabditis bovis]|uniref:aralkylamine N-acetyltransferase n=1 Tax=Caenorhabditis bovis TaxID=2654633 RepID=A0A8S1EZX9_9PELO|nr:unnamed protein product [Caenorhabditis bovis]
MRFSTMSAMKYVLQTLTKPEKPEVLKFLIDNFRVDEPLTRAAQMSPNEAEMCFNAVMDRCLKHPLSVVARCKESDEIVGCMLNSVWRKSDAFDDVAAKRDDFTFGSDRLPTRTVAEILNEVHSKFWSVRPRHDVVIHFEIVSVSKRFQRQGMASKMLEWTEDVEKLKSVNATAIMAEATSLGNQVLLTRKGYEIIHSLKLNTKRDSEGRQILNCDNGTDRVLLVVKEFEY